IYLEENSPIYSYGFPVTVSNGSTSQKLHVIKSGVGGDTVARLIRRIGDYTGAVVDGIEPDLITVMAGINDSLRQDSRKYAPAAEYGNDLRALIRMIRSRTAAGIVLMTPSYNDDGTSAESSLDPYAAAMKEAAHAEQVKLVDVHRLWMDHMILNGAVKGQGTWLSAARPGDHCHPAPDGHEATALLIFRELFPDPAILD
ncbi:MAG: hypothetical protein K0R57_2386, partial [Paenibacillaceae bacterium]|nr:hypothetical protein [Paenibacillaceae bacterium]